MGTIIGMYGTGTFSTTISSNVASIDVPKEGLLIGVSWAMRADLDADGEHMQWELSFGSSGSFTVNDTRQVIDVVDAGIFSVVTSGGGVGEVNRYTPLPDIPVGMGERIYLHAVASASIVAAVHALLHFDFDLDKALTRRR